MTSILGYADLLLDNEIDPERVSQLRTIKRNGSFLLEIINDILDLSKIEADKLVVEKERFAAHKVVRDVVSLMQVRADEKGLKFKVEFDGPIPAKIENDSRRLKQILVNLVGNAIKFTESGSVRLVVRFLLGNQSTIQFDVIDTGIGMTQRQQEQLFQPFAQGDASVSRAYGGTGLGLAISRRLAVILGGDITVTSKPGKGSMFSCTIAAGDISDEEMIQPNLAAITDSWKGNESDQQLKCRVLVVDDRRDVRLLTRSFLSKAGAQVDTAEDGQEALEKIVRSMKDELPTIDLILLDMQMPRLDGYQTAAALRKLGYQNPIIALTADAMHGDMNRCIECGCNAYLSKPIDSTELIATVGRHLGIQK
jgi:CheY-like chemotaxis protein